MEKKNNVKQKQIGPTRLLNNIGILPSTNLTIMLEIAAHQLSGPNNYTSSLHRFKSIIFFWHLNA